MAEDDTQEYLLGIDIGTTNVKVALVDCKTNEVLHSFTRQTNATWFSDLRPLGNEQDPGQIITEVQFCVSSVPKEKLMRVQKIGISGQMHGVMFWKADEGWLQRSTGRYNTNKTSQLFTWQDGRCTTEFLATLPEPKSHLRLATGHGCATIFWLHKNKPEFLLDYDCAGTIQDYVVAAICDLEKPIMSIQNAASWGYFDTNSEAWNISRLIKSGFPVHYLPSVVKPGEIIGRLKTDWYRIPQGTPVGVALGDLQCSILPSLIQHKDTGVLNISTSAQLAFEMPERFTPPLLDPKSPIEYFPYFHERYLAVAASLTGGNTMVEFIKMIKFWAYELDCVVDENAIWERLLALGESVPETDLEIVPTIYGERHNPEQSASVSHINPGNIKLGSVFRALCHGIVENLHSMMPSTFLKEAGITKILGCGGALTRNSILKKEVENMFLLPVSYLDKNADAAVGAAMAMKDSY